MNNPLKRQSSNDDTTDSQNNNKHKKQLYTDFRTTSLKPYTDHHSFPTSHLPPSPPIIVDIPTPSPVPTNSVTCPPTTSIHTADSIPTMKRFTINTRHHYEQQQQEYTLSDYANINQILHEAHIQRHGDPSVPTIDSDMMDCDGSNYYDYANTILRQAFLQRHSSPPG